MQLRPYQSQAVAFAYKHLRSQDNNPCIVIPTGGGKTYVIAQIAKDTIAWEGRAIVLAHVKELLEQNAEKIHLAAPDLKFGMYSAGLNRRDTSQKVIVAGIQSAYKRAEELGPFNIVIVDEAHLIPPDGEGMYRTFLAAQRQMNPGMRVIGLTATPYRMKSGLICAEDKILNEICFHVGVRELIIEGYLAPLTSKAGISEADARNLHVRAGEFVPEEVEALMDDEAKIVPAVAEIVEKTKDRKACLIFCASIKHAKHVAEVFSREHGLDELSLFADNAKVATIFGTTSMKDRAETVARFRQGHIKYLINVQVLTHGFDVPHVDCIALMRPTLSPGLYYQMVGRGFRMAEDKENCLVLDFGGNVRRHGPVDAIVARGSGTKEKPDKEAEKAKMCPECREMMDPGYECCPSCGYVFPKPQRNINDPKASEDAILSSEVTEAEYKVYEIDYYIHHKKDAPEGHPPTMRVEYRIGIFYRSTISEWICFEHTGYARAKAEKWWARRSQAPMPDTVKMAIEIARMGGVAPAVEIKTRQARAEKYERIVGYKLGDIPDWEKLLLKEVESIKEQV